MGVNTFDGMESKSGVSVPLLEDAELLAELL
jgi:hypothetical protein